MGQAIGQYISSNQISLVKDLMFCILGVILGLIFSRKKPSPSIHNNTSMSTINIIIKNIMIQHVSKPKEIQKSTKQQVYSEGNNDFIGWVVFLGIIGAIYSKYHMILLDLFTGLTLFVLTSLITLSIKLYWNNQYDRLNQWWTILGFILTALNFITILFISKQDILNTGGLDALFRIMYYAVGFIIILIPNLFVLILIVHLFAVNSFLLRHGAISMFLIRKTAWLVKAPKAISIMALITSLIAIFFSSGKAYEVIRYHNEKSMNVINQNFK